VLRSLIGVRCPLVRLLLGSPVRRTLIGVWCPLIRVRRVGLWGRRALRGGLLRRERSFVHGSGFFHAAWGQNAAAGREKS